MRTTAHLTEREYNRYMELLKEWERLEKAQGDTSVMISKMSKDNPNYRYHMDNLGKLQDLIQQQRAKTKEFEDQHPEDDIIY